jgi:D-cysteine desulfhydrase
VTTAVRDRIAARALPSYRLASLPTPLELAPVLSGALGVTVLIKRDDLTGLLLGGNKARKLDYLCGEALAEGCDTLVTGGGPGSNHLQMTAAAAVRVNRRCVLVCYGEVPGPEPLGLRLIRRLGADVVFTGSSDRASVDTRLQEVADDLRSAGHHPYVIPRGGASAVGAVGYALAAEELVWQLAPHGNMNATVLLATGSCGTQAGLLAGAAIVADPPEPEPTPGGGRTSTRATLEAMPPPGGTRPEPPPPFQVVGVPVSRPLEECAERVARLATGCAERLGSSRVFTAGDVNLLGGYLGPGYGRASPEGDEAALLAARTEALLLDPVFTAKAMAALIAEARAGRLTDPVVFLHTGGTPAALAALP